MSYSSFHSSKGAGVIHRRTVHRQVLAVNNTAAGNAPYKQELMAGK